MKVITVDCQYVFPKFAAAYVIVHGDRAVIVENNTTHSVPLILDALRGEGLSPENVDYVIITHVHLDHAGGSSLLMNRCPNAKLLAHPRAVKHLVDPEKLVASARKVYGDEAFDKLYGRINPIPASRVIAMEDGQSVSWPDVDGAELRFLHTRGHANHHFCVIMVEKAEAQAVFTGDAFGVMYPALQEGGLFIFPSTSPTDFDPDEARNSIRKIVAIGAPVAYLTHFGALSEVPQAGGLLIEEIDFSERLLNEAIHSGKAGQDLTQFCEIRVRARMKEVFTKSGRIWDKPTEELLDIDLRLNAAGVACVAEKRLEKGEILK
jgi:glyoxylase-like metal-dependent hydrolase (beta-lactamase superfamily II)